MNKIAKETIKILAIESSCDETAAAIIEKNGNTMNILSNVVASQIPLHAKFGGVFPEHASRAHSEIILPVVESALSQKAISHNENKKSSGLTALQLMAGIDLIAVTTGPGLIGSLLVGVNFAKTLSFATSIPVIGINHWLGHIYSNFVGENPNDKFQIPKFPALILIVSGGHTGLVLMKSHTEIETLGETLDDAAGEAFDKVAKLLELGYPGGPAISTEAEKFNRQPSTANRIDIQFPKSMLDRPDYNFSFSGLKTAVLYKVKELTKRYPLNAIRSQVAYEFQQTTIDILVGKTIQAALEFSPKSVCLCGGVSANNQLREQLKTAVDQLPSKPSYHVPLMELTTDNAAMIGVAAAYHLDKLTDWQHINADANLKI